MSVQPSGIPACIGVGARASSTIDLRSAGASRAAPRCAAPRRATPRCEPHLPCLSLAAAITPRLLAVLIAALVAAAAFGVGIGIGAAICEGSSSPPSTPPAAATATATASWLFVVTADAGTVVAAGCDALTIKLSGTAPRAVAFTDRPQRKAKAVKTPDLWAALYADGAAPPNAALSF
jgi:hypothetical protein